MCGGVICCSRSEAGTRIGPSTRTPSSRRASEPAADASCACRRWLRATPHARACAAWRSSTGATGSIARRPPGAIPTRCGARTSSRPGSWPLPRAAPCRCGSPGLRAGRSRCTERWWRPRACGRRAAPGRPGSHSGCPLRWPSCTQRGGRASLRAAGASACPGRPWQASSGGGRRRWPAPSFASATSSHASRPCLRPSSCASSPRSTRGRGCAASSSPSFPTAAARCTRRRGRGSRGARARRRWGRRGPRPTGLHAAPCGWPG